MNEIKNENIKVVQNDRVIAPETMQDNYLVDFAGIQQEYGINERQTMAAFLMATSTMSRTEVAKKIGINRKTLYAWLKKPGFLRLYNELCAYTLKSLQGRAVNTMGNLMGDEDPRVQFQAAKFIINTNMGVQDGPTIETPRDATEDILEILVGEVEIEEVVVDTTETDYDYANDIIDPSEII